MNPKSQAILLVILCSLFTSPAQIFYKIGSAKLSWNFFSMITNYHIIIGLFLYGVGALLLVAALSKGELSVLYPIVATSYIWVAILSAIFLNENFDIYKLLGILTIVTGVTLVGVGSK